LQLGSHNSKGIPALNLIKAISSAPLVINDKVSLTFAVFKPTTVSIVASAGSIQSRYLTNALVS
jgi:hypothetical protein